MAGFTAMTEVHGDEFAADAADDFCRGVRELLPGYDAEEIKSIGDAVMLRVPEADSAVELALRLISELGMGHGALALRVGAHTGPAVRRGDDWFGAAVNLAARVADAAGRGELLMTADTRSAAESTLSKYELEHRGTRTFKNVADPVDTYALTLAQQPEAADLPIDPVCRMAVDPSRSERRTYEGEEFHFCSTECAQVFDQRPDQYRS